LAQRAYRARKENTISSLKDQVDGLHKTIEEMNRSFLSFHDKVISADLLDNNSALASQLRDITHQFFLLAKSSAPSLADSADSDDHEEGPSSPEPVLPLVMSNSEPRPFKELSWGYVEYVEPEDTASSLTPPRGSPASMPIDLVFSEAALPKTLSVTAEYKNSSGSGSSRSVSPLPFFGRISTPPSLEFMDDFSIPRPPTQLKAAYTFSMEEPIFHRRLHRASLERAYHLLASNHQFPEKIHRVFQLSLIYHTRESLMAGIHGTLQKDSSASLDHVATPFIHLGGAGTHFGGRKHINSLLIKADSVHKRSRLINAQTGFDVGLEIKFDANEKSLQGDWFDAYDVQGYMEHLGLRIEPGAVFAEASVPDDSALVQLLRQNGTALPSSQSVTRSIDWDNQLGTKNSSSMNLFPELGLGSDLNERTADDITGWIMGGGDRSPTFSQMLPWGGSQLRNVTVDVGAMVECKLQLPLYNLSKDL
jgi:hypothetical protein